MREGTTCIWCLRITSWMKSMKLMGARRAIGSHRWISMRSSITLLM
jgi:hypothetical protein